MGKNQPLSQQCHGATQRYATTTVTDQKPTGKTSGELATAERYQLVEAYCVERCRWLECERYLSENGEVLTLRTERGEPRSIIEAPQVRISERAQERMLTLGSRIGLGRVSSNT